MAQAPDILDTLADALWALFEAQSSITTAIVPANRNKGDQVGWLRDAIAAAPMDRRRMEISFERGRTTFERLGFTKEDTEIDAGCDFRVIRQQTALITYREPLPTDPGAHSVQRSIEHTILLAFPTLDLDMIPGDGLGELTWEERKTRKDEFPQAGRVTTYRLPITTIQSGLALRALTA